jgi:hypothetical protein
MSSVGKLVVLVVILAVLGVVAHDAFEITRAQKDVRSAASSAASAAATAIACAPSVAPAKCAPSPGVSPGAKTAAGKAAAVKQAASSGDVVTAYVYDPVANKVELTLGANASTWVLSRLHRAWTDGIKASSSASPPTIGVAK